MSLKTKHSAIITPDGELELPQEPRIEMDTEYSGAAALHGHIVFNGMPDVGHIALARDLYQDRLLELVGKSGTSRAGLELLLRDAPDAEFDFEKGRIALPVRVLSLRAVEVRQNGVRDDMLRVLMDMAQERPVPIGRLAIVQPQDALSRDEIMDAIRHFQIALPDTLNPEEAVDSDGYIVLPLDDVWYAFCEMNFRTEEKRRVIRYGKHGLSGVQEERSNRPEVMSGKSFFVGGVRISLGAYTAIIDRQTNTEEVVHLAARLLDGIRTSGLNVYRQVELFNKRFEPVRTSNLAVRLRLFHSSKGDQYFAKNVITKRTITEGVSFANAVGIDDHPERLTALMDLVGPSVRSGKPYGYFVGSGRGHKVPWVKSPSESFQAYHLQSTAPKFSAKDPDYFASRELPQPVEDLSKQLAYVGQQQTHANMFASYGFPDPATIESMRSSGIGVFVAHNTSESSTAYRTSLEGNDEDSSKYNPFFTHARYSAMQDISRRGARFYLVRPSAPDAFGEQDTLPSEVLEWNERGFWIKPNVRERLNTVDTVIAMYGSHVQGMEKELTEQITKFALRLKKRLGSHIAFEHGKGPGVMYITDRVARELPELAKRYPEYSDIREDIISIGVGIDLEQLDQRLNHHPHCQVDFVAHDRLVRQKIMNDRASFNIFNIGGSGTLEEVALSLCSHKLHNNIATPLIFVDPLGLSETKGENLYSKLVEFIEDIATQKIISPTQAEQGKQNVQLLQAYTPNFLHVVSSYDEAADVIETFLDDPVGYYIGSGMTLSDFRHDIDGAIRVRRETKFPMPHWMAGERLSECFLDERWRKSDSQ